MFTQIIQFATEHWLLSFSAVLLISLIIREELNNLKKGIAKISLQNAILTINRGTGMILDLRESGDFAHSHIHGAIGVPFSEFNVKNRHLESLEITKDLILINNGKNNLASVTEKLRNLGFKKIFVLDGGMTAWREAGFPLVGSN